MPGFGGLNQREEHYVSIPDWPDSDVAGGPGPGVQSRNDGTAQELTEWVQYDIQLDDMVCALLEDENGYFCENELRMFRMVEKQSGRLRDEAARTLREYVLQVRELFQAEIDIRQNRIMKTLAIVTTIFLPLSLVAGWNGMNFVDMLKLRWRYGYPAVTRHTKRN